MSPNGGTQVRWRKDGKELFYVEGDSLMAAPISTTPTLTIGSAERLFSDAHLTFGAGEDYLNYDVAPDGRKFIVREPELGDSEVRIRVVQNWHEEFRDREQD